ncbi:(2Fe-2S)-binding protein [Parafrankia elaeagni]|uniref:(2Fe-2S)-binding protein n=1 Tax=Parafrankia elaeagni TaxID=222534 RepID=UPI000381972B|nr:(2Fe-2S)-binding protein [Parafrankia elaeagni]
MSGSAEPVDGTRVRSALLALTAISPYFEADIPPPGSPADAGAGGDGGDGGGVPVPVEELYRGGAALAAAIDGVNARLGGVERRVAASTLALGHAARLWSVALGCWATTGIVPDLDPSVLRVQPRLTAPLRLIVDRPTGRRPAPPVAGTNPATTTTAVDSAADLLREVVVERNLRPYFAAVQRQTRLPAGLLWGNAASALVGATRVLIAHLASTDPVGSPAQETTSEAVPAGAAVGRVTALLLATPPLAHTTVHALTADGQVVPSTVVRRSCCLFYRVPGGGTCGDCPLHGPQERTPR